MNNNQRQIHIKTEVKLRTKVSMSLVPITKVLIEHFGFAIKLTGAHRKMLIDHILLAIEHHYDLSQISEKEIDNIIEYVSVKIILKYLLLFPIEELQETRDNFNQFFDQKISDDIKRNLLESRLLVSLVPKNTKSMTKDLRL